MPQHRKGPRLADRIVADGTGSCRCWATLACEPMAFAVFAVKDADDELGTLDQI